jgi:hypothetical protein
MSPDPRSRSGLTPDQRLALRAALEPADRARRAWQEYLAAGRTVDDLAAGAYRLLPQLYRNLRTVVPDDPLLGRLKSVHRRTWYANQLHLRACAGAVADITAGGTEVLLWGSVAVAVVVEDVGICPIDAVELLVRPGDAGRAAAALEAEGWAASPPVRSSVTFSRNGEGVRVRSAAPRRRDAGSDVWASAQPVSLGGAVGGAPSIADLLLATCARSAGRRSAPLHWIPDAVLLARAAGRIDPDALATRARERRVTLSAADALELLAEEFDLADARCAATELRRTPAGAGERLVHRVKLHPAGRSAAVQFLRRGGRRWVATRRKVI